MQSSRDLRMLARKIGFDPDYVTNFLAIMLAGGLTFLLGGLGRLAITDDVYHIIAVNVNDRAVVVTVDSSGELRPLKQLATSLATRLARPILVNLRVVPSQVESSE